MTDIVAIFFLTYSPAGLCSVMHLRIFFPYKILQSSIEI